MENNLKINRYMSKYKIFCTHPTLCIIVMSQNNINIKLKKSHKTQVLGCCFWHTSFYFPTSHHHVHWGSGCWENAAAVWSYPTTATRKFLNLKRREWLHRQAFFPGELHAQMSLVGYSPCVAKSRTRQQRTHTHRKLGFLGGSHSQESVCNVGDLGSTPGSGRSHGEGNCYPSQDSHPENSMDRGAWQATVHGMAKSQTTEQPTLSL